MSCANRIAYIFNIFNIYLFIHIRLAALLCCFWWWITISVIQHYRWLTCLRLACSVCLLVNRLSLLSLTTSSAFALPAQDFVNKTVENHRWIETVSSARNKKWRRLPDTVPSNTQGWRILPSGTHCFWWKLLYFLLRLMIFIIFFVCFYF